jgi:hypothetical protein
MALWREVLRGEGILPDGMLAHPILDHDSFVFHADAIAPLSVGLPGRSDRGLE